MSRLRRQCLIIGLLSLHTTAFPFSHLLGEYQAAQVPATTTTTTSSSSSSLSNLPLVIWHGLGDTYDSDGIASIGALVNKTIGPTYTYNIRLDDDPSADRTATFLGNLNDQIDQVCHDLAIHPTLSLSPAINALGFSQGGQFLRAYVERCNSPPVANLVTFGSQHNGISEFQACKAGDWLCYTWDGLLKSSTWTAFVQGKLVPAQYFRDPEDLESYLAHSNFLADINNERPGKAKNATYRRNMCRLEKFAMYMFAEDTTVVPKESAFFGEVNGTSEAVVKLQDRELYRQDWLGLKWLDEQGRLDFKVAPGGHMQLEKEVLEDAFRRYFRRKPAATALARDEDLDL